MKLKIGLAIFIVLAVIGGLGGIKALQFQKMMAGGESFVPPPEAVASAVVRQEKWQGSLTAIGTITAVQGVTVSPEIAGLIKEIAFESGAIVRKGDSLVVLDASLEEAQLRAAQAQSELARLELDRVRRLFNEKTVSRAELDTAEAAMKQTQANADAIRATIEKKHIRAPFAGQLGLRLVNLGQYLDVGKPIVSLQSLAPVYAGFTLPQQELAQLGTGMGVRLRVDTYPGRVFEGKLTAINPDLDQSTRSVGLQATFENRDQLLRPGMFARVEVLLAEERDVLVVPATAILSAPFGDSVYLIEPKPPGTNGTSGGLVVRQQFVRTGQRRGDFVCVDTGLKAGQKIVSAGLFKLRNGVAVTEENDATPKPSETPRPADS